MILELNQELMRAAAAGNLEAAHKLVLRGAVFTSNIVYKTEVS